MKRALAVLLCSSFWLAGSALAQDVAASHEAICCGSSCCLIDGDCLTDGEPNSRNACQVCDPSMSQVEWTPVAGCDAGQSAQPDAGSDAGASGGGGGGCAIAPGASGAFGGLVAFGALALVWRRRR